MTGKIEHAEFKSRRRAHILLVLAFILSLVTVMKLLESESSMTYQKVTWFLIIAAAALNLSTLPYAMCSKPLSKIMNDELAQLYRLKSLATGFWAAIFATLTVFVISNYIVISNENIIISIASFALISALVRFSTLELKTI